MRRKRMRWALVGMMVLAVSGCAEKSKYGLSEKDPVVINIWTYYNGAQKTVFDKKIQEFNESLGRDMGIVVEHSNRGSISELTQAVDDSMEGHAGAEPLPDIFSAYADTAYHVNQKGMAVDLSQYLTSDEIAEYVDAYMEEGRLGSDGGLRLFPIAKSTEVLALNKTDWDKFSEAVDVSEESLATWEGIAETAKLYYEWTDNQTPEPEDGKAFFGRDAFANYMIIGSLQLEHEIYKVDNENAQLDFDEDTMRRLWENYYVPYVNGYFGSYGKFRSDDMKTGDLLAYVGSTSSITYLPSTVEKEDGTKYEIESRQYPTPNFQGTEPCAVQQGAGMLVVKSEEKREYAAVTFLKWFTEVEHNTEFSLASGYLPVRKEALQKENEELQSAVGGTLSPLSLESVGIGMKIVDTYRLYTTKAFEDGDKARDILNTTMDQKAAKDRAQVVAHISSGMSREDAVKPFITDENFEQWYQDTKRQLVAIGE